MEPDQATLPDAIDDAVVVDRVRRGEVQLFEILMRRYNQRLFRVARSIVGGDAEAEEVVQDSYVRAFERLAQFEGRSRFSTWMTRIVVHEAIARKKRRQRFVSIDEVGEAGMGDTNMQKMPGSEPRTEVLRRELRAALESSIGELPERYRHVFMLREVEGMSTEETATSLELGEEAVKSRLLRARSMLRKTLEAQFGCALNEVFTFGKERCDRMVAAVMQRINHARPSPGGS